MLLSFKENLFRFRYAQSWLYFLSQGVVGQTKEQKAQIYILRCPGGDDQNRELVDVKVEVLAKCDDQAEETIITGDSDYVANNLVAKLKSSDFMAQPDSIEFDGGDNSGCDDSNDCGFSVEEIRDDTQGVITIKKKKKIEKQNEAKKEKQFYACKRCDKLFAARADCLRHEKACEKSVYMKVVVNETGETDQMQDLPGDAVDKGRVNYASLYSIEPDNEDYYQCPLCPKKVRAFSNFNSHVRTVHERYRPHTCAVCQCKFATRNNFNNHQIAVHTRKCSSCGSYVAETEPWPEGVTKHTARNIVCGNCNSVVLFYSGTKVQRTLSSGMKSVSCYKTRAKKHDAGRQTYACEICDKLFNKLYDCKRHQQKHADGSYNMCDVCGRQFKQYCSLQQHLKIHEESFVPYSCWVCNKKMEQKKSLIQHVKQIHGLDYKEKDIDQSQAETSTPVVLAETTIDTMGNTVFTF